MPGRAPALEATGTTIYVTLTMPDSAKRVAALDVDGVGLLRAEFMLTEAPKGRHPRDLMARGEQRQLVGAMAASVGRIAAAFAPVEHDPMIGYRSCYGYVRDPDLFGTEREAFAWGAL